MSCAVYKSTMQLTSYTKIVGVGHFNRDLLGCPDTHGTHSGCDTGTQTNSVPTIAGDVVVGKVSHVLRHCYVRRLCSQFAWYCALHLDWH